MSSVAGASSVDDDQTRVPPTPTGNESPGNASPTKETLPTGSGGANGAELQRTSSRPSIYHFMDQEGQNELSRRLSRSYSRLSTHTQDPSSDEFDFKMHLQHALKKGDEHGVVRRTLGVAVKGLNVIGRGSGVKYNTTIGSLALMPFKLGSIVKGLMHPTRKFILKDFEGSVQPGEMLLVLGRPGSGCSTLLKTLSNNIEGYDKVEGLRSYDGASPEEMRKHHAGDLAYLPEDDVHLPTLTVGDTLSFASATRQPAADARVGSRQDAINEKRDVLMALLGLRHTVNTKVGNDIIRGVSGGERKRVSIAEVLATGAKLACHDNSTRGLDASTALEYCRALRIATDVSDASTVLSIYQCGEGIFQLFDQVAVLYDGELVYWGPMEEAVSYFVEMGYKPLDRQTSPDFCVSVTDPRGRFIREGVDPRSVPQTAKDMAAYWRKSELGKKNAAKVQAIIDKHATSDKMDKFRESARQEKAKHLSPKSAYVISYPMQLRLAMVRRAKMMINDAPTTIIITCAAIFQALIIGSVYYKLADSTAGFFSRGGVLFFAILYNAFTGLAEIANSYAQRPVIVRQRQFAMLRPSCDMLAWNLVDIVPKTVSLLAFNIILYFLSGLAYTADQWFVFLLFTWITTMSMLALFRALASANRFEPNATMAGGLVILVVAIYTGYAIPRPSMRVYFRWLSYAQPISFGFEALVANEFRRLNVPCAQLVPQGPGYEGINIANQVCAQQGAQPGSDIVVGADYLQAVYGYTYANTWRNLGIIIGFWIFFLAINLITSEYQRDESAAGGVVVFKRGAAPKELHDAIEGKGLSSDPEKNEGEAPAPQRIGEAQSPVDGGDAKEEAANNLERATDIFTWRNVCYDIEIKGEPRRLLDNVSGFVMPGKMTCLMGESGKTTLLNVLAQRVDMGTVTGDMFVNGKPLPTSFQRQTGYCQQQDVHMPTATVREALQFSALLRQPAKTPKSEKLAYVEEVIKLLEMEAYAEAIVGEVGQGLNVEQRKRLTIAVELAARPALLVFLDEPTSGLDSQSSWSIVQLLRKLADHGQAILCTIHQPSGELFNVFDRLLLLKKGGQVVYNGPIGENSKTMIEYFEARTDLKCGADENPAEYILNAIGAGAGQTAKQDWAGLWRESKEFDVIQQQIDQFHNEYANRQSAADAEPDSDRNYAAHTITQIQIVTKRAFQNYWRDPTYLGAKIALNIIAGLFIGFSFFKSPNTVAGSQNYLFAVFMGVVMASPLSQQLQPKFLDFRTLYQARERPSRMYNWPTMVFSAVVVEMPWNIVAGTLFFFCWYWTVGFPYETNRAGYAYFMFVLFELYFPSFAQFVAAMAPNAMLASVLFATFFSFVIIFNGVVQPYAQLPYFWRVWMYRLTPFTYLIEGLLANAMGGLVIRCSQQELLRIQPPAGQECVAWLQPFTSAATGYAEVLPDGGCGYCQYSNGDQFLATVNMSFSNRWRDLGIMVAYVAFNIAAVFAVTYVFNFMDLSSFKKKKTGSKPATSTPASAPATQPEDGVNGGLTASQGSSEQQAIKEAEKAPVEKQANQTKV
ncbi:ATP-binding cassette transporter snq2 [Microbotryomycetes sp. JL201]|nr:ATP-binding cassette transporter snq2 [Microbotryomycetes sp. JL201]